MKTTTGYKFIKKDMKSEKGNHKWKVGKWYKEEEIKLCGKGFHACKEPLESLDYVYGDKWFIVEARGKIIEREGDKFVIIKNKDQLIMKKAKDFSKSLEEDLIFAKRTEDAWQSYERGEFKNMDSKDFLKELGKW